MTYVKKTWYKPEMIVLVRNNPEEAVLSFCKRAGGNPGGPRTDQCNRDIDDDGKNIATHCDTLSKS